MIHHERLFSELSRREFVRKVAGAAALLGGRLAGAAEAGKPGNEDILAQCAARIAQHRQGAGVITVRTKAGEPMPGATVKLEQLRHDFLFGCNLFRFGRIADQEREEAYRQRFAALLNYATLGFYWAAYEPRRGEPQYAYTDQVADWCRQNGIRPKGHPLVWDYADPRWLPQDFAEIANLSHARVRDIVSRFKGRLDFWDVVNEPTHLGRFKTRLGEWAMSLGAVPYVRQHLQIARQANPQATLLVNDYRTDPPFERILDGLHRDGKPLFNAIGIQSHMHGGGWPLAKVWEVCDRFKRFAVPLHFTETTIVSGPRLNSQRWGPSTPAGEAAQADYVPQFYTTLFAHPAVQAITWWDFSDDGAWQGAAAGWVRTDMSPKPVYDRMLDLIKRDWWTRTAGTTDGQGEFRTRAFFGVHRATVQPAGGRSITRELNWEKAQPNQFEIVVG